MFFPLTLSKPSGRTSIVLQAAYCEWRRLTDWHFQRDEHPLSQETQSSSGTTWRQDQAIRSMHLCKGYVNLEEVVTSPQGVGHLHVQDPLVGEQRQAFGEALGSILNLSSVYFRSLLDLIDPFDSLLHGLVSLTTSIWSLLSPLFKSSEVHFFGNIFNI